MSLLAVGAALWSVRLQEEQFVKQQQAVDAQLEVQNDSLALQRQALAKQDEQIKQQTDALTAQIDLQRQALKQQETELLHQREALEAELRYRRHAALREAYGPFLAAVGSLHGAVHECLKHMMRSNYQADREIRAVWRVPVDAGQAEVDRTLHSVVLVDTSNERGGHRWELSRGIRTEPWVDTIDNQRDWMDVVLNEWSERTDHLVALRNSLHKEFGDVVSEPTSSAKDFQARNRAEMKVKAEAAEARISAQLKELVEKDAIRSGRLLNVAQDHKGKDTK